MAKKQQPPKAAVSAPAVPVDFEKAEETRRIKDVPAARTIFQRFVTDNTLRSATFSQTRNQLEGGRPYDQAALESQGAGFQTNVNFGDARASRDRTLLPYWNMINNVPHRAAFTIESTAPQADKWNVAYAESFDDFLKDWGAGYFTEYMVFASNFVNFGPGIVQWSDSICPRFKAVNVQRIYFPKDCRMSPDEWEVVALERDMSASELYSKVRDGKKSARSDYAGWNVNAIKTAIVYCAGGGDTPNYQDFTRINDMLVNNDLAITTPFQPLKVVWLYVKNFDGKIGCYAFSPSAGVNDFLFRDDDYAESYRQILGAVWYDTGADGMVASIKGFGIKNYYFSNLINRTKSRIVDSATMGLGMNFQYDQDNMPDEAPPIEQYGPVTLFPSGMKQLPVYPNIKTGIDVMEILSNNQAENNAIYRQSQSQIENADTATQANILATQGSQMSEASAAIYLSQVGDNVFTEQVRRLRKKSSDPDAKKFQKRLRDRGVPDVAIFDMDIRVSTGANAGMANPAIMAQKFQQGLALSQQPGVNARWFLENFIAYNYGSWAVDKAMLPEGEESVPVQRRQANMENVDFGQGVPLAVAPSDAHFEHIQEHLKPAAQIAQQFQQTQKVSPEQASSLVILMEHAGQHMTYLQADDSRKNEFRTIKPQFAALQGMARGIITQMQRQQQQGGQPQMQGTQQPQQPMLAAG